MSNNAYTIITRVKSDNYWGKFIADDKFFRNSPDMSSYVRAIERKKCSHKQKGRKK